MYQTFFFLQNYISMRVEYQFSKLSSPHKK